MQRRRLEVDDADDTESGVGGGREGWTGVVLGPKHLAALERGEFLLDLPRVERLADLGVRLATLGLYDSTNEEGGREIRGARAAMFMSDVQDFLEVLAQLQRRQDALAREHMILNRALVKERMENDFYVWLRAWARLQLQSWVEKIGIARFLDTFLPRLRDERDGRSRDQDDAILAADQAQISAPFLTRENRRHRGHSLLFSVLFAVTSQVLSWYFAFAEMNSAQSLYAIAISALLASLLGRVLTCFLYWKIVDWAVPQRVFRFGVGVLWSLIDAELAINVIASGSLIEMQSVQVSDVRTSQAPQKDIVAAGASADFRLARGHFYMNCVNLLTHVPLLVVQAIAISDHLRSRSDVSPLGAAVLAFTSAFVLVQGLNLRAMLSCIPHLRLLLNARHIVIDYIPLGDGLLDDGDAIPDDDIDAEEEDDDDDDDNEEQDATNYDDAESQSVIRARQSKVRDVPGNTSRASESEEYPPGLWGTLQRAAVTCKTLAVQGAKATGSAGRALIAALRESLGHDDAPENSVAQRSAKQVMARYTDPPVPEYVDFSLFPQEVRMLFDVYTVSDFYQRIGLSPTGPGASDTVRSSICLPLNRMHRDAPFTALRTLQVTNEIGIGADTLAAILQKLPTLDHLNLSYCENIDDDAMRALGDAACPLETLYLDGCLGITDAGVEDLAFACGRALLKLSLRNVVAVSGKGLCHLAEHCPQLRELYLDRDPLLIPLLAAKGAKKTRASGVSKASASTSHSLASLLSTTLYFRHGDGSHGKAVAEGRMHDQGLAALATACPQLHTLTLDNATGFTERGLLHFIHVVSPFFRTLGLSGNAAVSDRCVGEIVTTLRHLRELRLSRTSMGDEGGAQLLAHARGIDCLFAENTAMTSAMAARLCESRRLPMTDSSLDAIAEKLLRQCELLQSKLEEGAHANGHNGASPGSRSLVESDTNEYSADEMVSRGSSGLGKAEVKCLRTSVQRYRSSMNVGCGIWQGISRAANIIHPAGAPVLPQRSLLAPFGRFPFQSLAPFGLDAVESSGLKFNLSLCVFVVMVPSAGRHALLRDDHDQGESKKDEYATSLYGRTSHVGSVSASMRGLLREHPAIWGKARSMVYLHPLRKRRHDLSFLDLRGSVHGLLRLVTWGGFAFFDDDGDFVGAVAKGLGATVSFQGPFEVNPLFARRLYSQNRFGTVPCGSHQVAFIHADEGGSRHNTCGAFVVTPASSRPGNCFMYTMMDAGHELAQEGQATLEKNESDDMDENDFHEMP
ncbi:F-box/LRR-repeat protein 2 [Hondaea fermentalgiana]|uniref:F-box/LRR-repeat protein 2 n=1 Tax=Hondaea fermentalgiana TaxID=2315210 RepID=A0A2R5GDS8_9STRA|nr:F-box/LRR-repeat protein 2 [Hondaea fermentalgiana]|eukprot:GBG29090.1 F-box/LRR-repeat protein 2 [Hondaea fermentalgiana]